MLADELPNLMQVRAFVRVAELGSVSKASEAAYRAQSVVTRAIAELEARLEVPLFERHVNGMRLTDYGARVLPRARRVLAELETVPRLLRGQRAKRSSRSTCSRPGACRCSSNSARPATCRRWRAILA